MTVHVYDLRPGLVSRESYADGTVVPHLPVLVFKDGLYHGYVEIHVHKVGDESVSIGITVRGPTEKKP